MAQSLFTNPFPLPLRPWVICGGGRTAAAPVEWRTTRKRIRADLYADGGLGPGCVE
jgi:hypothetical protein